MISVDKAKKIILKEARTLKSRSIPLSSSCGYVLSRDIKAECGAPDFSKSFMDGYALKYAFLKATPIILDIVENVPAGSFPKKTLKKNACFKVYTGSVLPAGCDTVIINENTVQCASDKVKILKASKKGSNIYKRFEFFKKGALLVSRGSVLNAAKVALLSSLGFKNVFVYRRPRVAILATGNEVVEAGGKKKKSQVYNATTPMFISILNKMGISSEYLGIAKDKKPLLIKKIKEGFKRDVLIITGAVSAGDFDFVPETLKDTGAKIIFHKVCLRPGKPFLFARKGKTLIFGVPGNPVSGLVCFNLFIKPALEKIGGLNACSFYGEAVLEEAAVNSSQRESFLPGRLIVKSGKYKIKPLRYCGSADLLGSSSADVFFIMGKNEARLAPGDKVRFLKFNP